MKKILVIGQDGMLGGELYERLCKKMINMRCIKQGLKL